MRNRIRKIIHQWLKDRGITGAYVVLRLDDYLTTPADRGQFYTGRNRMDDANKAVWGTLEDAQGAAQWAVRKFGHKYGVFQLVRFVEAKEEPIKVSVIKT